MTTIVNDDLNKSQLYHQPEEQKGQILINYDSIIEKEGQNCLQVQIQGTSASELSTELNDNNPACAQQNPYDSPYDFQENPFQGQLEVGQQVLSDIQRSRIQGPSTRLQQYLPQETKNISKNLYCCLRKFIGKVKNNVVENFPQECQTNKELKDFLKLNRGKWSKATLTKALQSKALKAISKQFFGQLHWASYFQRDNKAILEQYFRFNYQLWS